MPQDKAHLFIGHISYKSKSMCLTKHKVNATFKKFSVIEQTKQTIKYLNTIKTTIIKRFKPDRTDMGQDVSWYTHGHKQEQMYCMCANFTNSKRVWWDVAEISLWNFLEE